MWNKPRTMPRTNPILAARQNAAFLEALARTGNARLAARELGFNRSTFTKRRARSAAFAAEWDAALVAAHARFHRSGGSGAAGEGARGQRTQSLRTRGGEPTVVRQKNGRLQLCLAPPGRITHAAEREQRLTDSCNV